MRYLIVIEKTGNGFGAYAPDLPGVVAAGDTRDETIDLMREAVRMHVDDLRSQGQPVPEPTADSDAVDIAAA